MGHSQLTRDLIRSPLLAVWGLFLLMMPLYVFPSGLPQPDDAMIVLIAPIAFSVWNGRLNRSSVRILRSLIWFTLWVIVVDLAWVVLLSNWGLDLRYPLFYVFNALVFLIVLILDQKYQDSFKRLTLYCVFVSIIVQTMFALVQRSSSRGTVFFENPNQLGYYALLSACVIALLQPRLKFGRVKAGIGLSCCGYLALASASRAAVAGVAILVMLVMFSSPRVIIIGSLLAIVLFLVGGPVANVDYTMQSRINTPRGDDNLTFFEQRGYDRIWTNKQYLLLGAGEGAKDRFTETTVIKHAEIHSSVGTIFFSYGIVGLILFAVFLWRLIRTADIRTALILIPPLAYTAAHQGLRFTMLWVLLALFASLKPSPQPLRAQAGNHV